MKNLPLLLGTVFGTVLVIIVVAVMFSKSAAAPVSEGEAVDQTQLVAGANKVKGPENATVTIVEFSDFQCPSCKTAAPFVDQVMKQYPDSVKFVYRHFPLDTIHANARLAAQASEAALAQGKFWEYHDKLFAAQTEWQDIADKDELIAKFGEYAEELKIDKPVFLERIKAQSDAQIVQSDTELGNSFSVQATPTFFVNGKRTAAPQLLQAVQALTPETQTQQ